MSGMSLLEHFSALEDPRQSWKVVYPLPEILLLVLCATLGRSRRTSSRWSGGVEATAGVPAPVPGLRAGRSVHDTLCDVVSALDPELFRAAFAAWVGSLREAEPDIVAIDGKTSRRSHDRGKGRGPLHLVSAWASRQRLVLGQQATAEKSNEIEAIPLLLERLALSGALVTIDAMGATPRIAKAVLDRGADYLLALKANRATCSRRPNSSSGTPSTPTAWKPLTLTTAASRPGATPSAGTWPGCAPTAPPRASARFPGLKAIARVEAEVESGGKTTLARRYYLSSAPLDATTFARAVRAHWGLENRLHWVLDVVFHDDLARLRTGSGPENMAIVKHMALNLLNKTAKTDSLKTRRKRAGWDDDYLKAVITQTA